MVRLTLTKRIWLSFILLIMVIALIVAIIYPISIQQALKQDSFELIEQEQQRNVLPNIGNHNNVPKSGLGFIEQQQAARSVGNLVVLNGVGRLDGDPVPSSVLKQMMDHAQENKNPGEFELDYKGATLFYVTRQIETDSGKGYLVSYMWDTYRNQMVRKLWSRLIYVSLLAIFISLGFSAWLTRYLKTPLLALGKNFEEIAKLNWKKPFVWNSGDEFQYLADQFEHMRQNLLHYDESQKEFLQQASHELKTPIMVIQSYSEAVKDGILPNGLDVTMDIISGEAKRMENRVKKLLYYTRIDSLREETPKLESFSFGEIAYSFKERLAAMKPEVRIDVIGGNVLLKADREQLGTVLENLLENALRYAETFIELKAEERRDRRLISVTNDGPSIPTDQINALFEPYKKGAKGQFGLGLAIVKRIVERHKGIVDISNLENGVVFKISLPYEG